MKQEIDVRKLLLFCLALSCGLASAYYGQPLIHKNSDAVNVIVTVFSILAGFLVAIITLIGDVNSIPQGSWRLAHNMGEQTRARLTRHRDLFILYLLTLVLIFISILLKEISDQFSLWIERIYMFLAGTAFASSMALPHALMGHQEERLQAEIQRRRTEAGISDTSPKP